MPRIHNTGPLVQEWHERTGEGSGTADVCRSCWEDILDDPTLYQGELGEGSCLSGEPSQFWLCVGWPPEPFEDLDYNCAICDERLGPSANATDWDDRQAASALEKAIAKWEAEVPDIGHNPLGDPLTELNKFFN